mmetsp:Transcript_56903/g.161536  ORF Transcript_56903/g.161536 Transcript_56903/m.161536 type:complete len:226 (+) Transcript_56903:1239-1916(+)
MAAQTWRPGRGRSGAASPQSQHMGPRHRGQGTFLKSTRSWSGVLALGFLWPSLVRPQKSMRALVPPMPKPWTPMNMSVRAGSTNSVMMYQGKPSMSRCGFRLVTCTHMGMPWCLSMPTTLMTPEMPALASMWARFAFTVVNRIGFVSTRKPSMAARNAPTSMGSPRAVPVPWHSKQSTSGGLSEASRKAARMHFSCEGPLGAVMLAERPSWLAWEPATSAKTSRE